MIKLSVSESENNPDTGAYQLNLLIKENIRITVGALGIKEFRAGKYIYTGSAMKNLSKRIERHLKRKKVKRWHIDYLTTHPKVIVTSFDLYLSSRKEECDLNQRTLANRHAVYPIKGFGSSDCLTCESHLIYLG